MDSTKNLEYINVSRIASSSFWTPTVLKGKRYDVSYRQHVCTGIVENERRGEGVAQNPEMLRIAEIFFLEQKHINYSRVSAKQT